MTETKVSDAPQEEVTEKFPGTYWSGAQNKAATVPTPEELRYLLHRQNCDARGIVRFLLSDALSRNSLKPDNKFEDAVPIINKALEDMIGAACNLENIDNERFQNASRTEHSGLFNTLEGRLEEAIIKALNVPDKSLNIAHQIAYQVDNIIRKRVGLPLDKHLRPCEPIPPRQALR